MKKKSLATILNPLFCKQPIWRCVREYELLRNVPRSQYENWYERHRTRKIFLCQSSSKIWVASRFVILKNASTDLTSSSVNTGLFVANV